jgi:hypothetical protein
MRPNPGAHFFYSVYSYKLGIIKNFNHKAWLDYTLTVRR